MATYFTQVCPENANIRKTDFLGLETMDLCAVENITTSNDDDDGDDDDLYITRSLWALRARLLVGSPSGRLLALRAC